MSGAEVLVCGAATAVIICVSVYFSLLLRGAANDRLISEAIVAMLAARQRKEIPPQRQLLRAVAQTLADQERAASRITAAVLQSLIAGSERTSPLHVTSEILDLPEPQLLVTDFFAEYAGDPGSGGMFTAFAGHLVRTETRCVYPDLDEDGSPVLDRLAATAMEGRVAAVALAGLEVHGGPALTRAPLLTDGDLGAVEHVVRGLEEATRRQVRLATLLHSQAAANLRLRAPRDERIGEAIWSYLRRRAPGGPPDDAGTAHAPAALHLRLHRLLAAPRLRLQRLPFQQGDLDSLEVTLDAIGEVIADAVECLATGEPMRAIYLLAGVSVPVPAGLPGRIYNQDSLAQVRPLVALGVRHRLAVCRWAAAATNDAALQARLAGWTGLMASGGSGRGGSE